VLHLSIIHGAFPWLLGGVALGTLVVGIGWRNPKWRWLILPRLAMSVAGLTLVVMRLGNVEHWLGSRFPRSFYLWAALPMFAAAVAAAGWRTARRSERWASIAAVPLLLTLGADLIDVHYAYLPTLGDVLSTPIAHKVDARMLRPTLAAISGPMSWRRGEIVEIDIPSSKRFQHRPALVWLPPAWFKTPRRQLPVVELVAGVPGQPDNMIRAAGAGQVAAAYATSHGGLAPILVFPDHNGSLLGDTECVDGPRGAAETYLLVDVPAFLEQFFGASAGPNHLAVVGYSEGGTCAVTLALRHPEIVGTFVDIGGDIRPNLGLQRDQEARAVSGLYGGDVKQWRLHDPLTLLRTHKYASTAGWFEDGLADIKPLASARALVRAGKAAGMATTFIPAPGGHNFTFVRKAVADSFPWLAARLGLGPRA
jgi:dienelactone hydrolase